MSISKTHDKKSPTQNPVDFYKSKQFGGAPGGAPGGSQKQSVPDQLTGGPQRENVLGKK